MSFSLYVRRSLCLSRLRYSWLRFVSILTDVDAVVVVFVVVFVVVVAVVVVVASSWASAAPGGGLGDADACPWFRLLSSWSNADTWPSQLSLEDRVAPTPGRPRVRPTALAAAVVSHTAVTAC